MLFNLKFQKCPVESHHMKEMEWYHAERRWDVETIPGVFLMLPLPHLQGSS